MKQHIVFSIPLIAAMTTVAHAGDGPFSEYLRTGKWEVSGFGIYQSSGTASASANAVALKLGSGYGGGVDLGYNLNNHLNLHTDVSALGLDVTGTAGGASVTGRSALLNWNLNLDYNILKTRLTPFLTAGAGVSHFAGDFGVPGSDFNETDVCWGVGGGLRWDFSDHWFAEAVYRANWTSLKDTDSPTLFHTVILGIGYTF